MHEVPERFVFEKELRLLLWKLGILINFFEFKSVHILFKNGGKHDVEGNLINKKDFSTNSML
jgi:hypothetical protein